MRTRHLLVALAALFATTPALAQRPNVVPPPPSPAFDGSALGYDGQSDTVDLDTPPDFEGVLAGTDPLQDGKPYDAFEIDASRGTEITVTMTAEDFDTYLIVRSPSGRTWENDDFNGTRMSQVRLIATEPGTYAIWATAYRAEGRGSYEIRVAEQSVTVLSEVAGRLDYEDEQLVKGEFTDVLTIRPPAQGTFFVELQPLGFDGFVRVTTPSGMAQRAQSQGLDQRTIRLGPFRAERGAWTVDVTTLMPDEVGAYDLRVISLDEPN